MDGTRCTLTEEGPLGRRLRLEIDADQVASEVEAGLRQVARRARFKGFRPGKAPLDMVRTAHAAEVAEEVRQRLMGQAFQEALGEHDLKPVGTPEMRVESLDTAEGGPLVVEFSMELPPDFELVELDGIPITVHLPAVDDPAVETEARRFRESHGWLEDAPQDQAVGAEDILQGTARYEVDGVDVPERPDRPAFVRHDLVDGLTLPEAKQRLEGAQVGDTLEFSTTLPDNFTPAEAAGRPATLRYTIERHQRVVLPEWDAELLGKAQVDSIEGLHERIREKLQQMVASHRAEQADRAIREHLVDAHPFELPSRLLALAIDRRVHEAAHQLMQHQNLEAEESQQQAEQQRQAIAQATTRSLKASFIYSRIAREQSLGATEAEAEEHVRQQARQEGRDPGRLADEARSEGWLADVRVQLTEQKTREWLRSKARITEEVHGMAAEETPA